VKIVLGGGIGAWILGICGSALDDGRGGRGGAQRTRRKARGDEVYVPHPSPDQAGSGWGTRRFEVSRGERLRLRDAHLSDDEAVAKMGHPVLWSRVRDEPNERCLTGVVGASAIGLLCSWHG
jgi:hypothetical protein